MDFVVVVPLGDQRHQDGFLAGILADVLQAFQVELERLARVAEVFVHFGIEAVEGKHAPRARFAQPPAVVLVGQLESVRDHARAQTVGIGQFDQFDEGLAHSRFAAEPLNARPGVVRRKMLEDFSKYSLGGSNRNFMLGVLLMQMGHIMLQRLVTSRNKSVGDS